ncbi:MAG TPA: AsmA-like C-terminal region-containing protein, partial [Casimicrobiaceae bacterium]
DAVVHFAGELFTLGGSIVRAGDVFDVDADIKVDGVDAEPWLIRLRRSDANAHVSPWAWPLRGKIAVRVGHVAVLGYRVEPFVASVALGDREVSMNVTEARLCGFSAPLTVSATPATVDVKGHADAYDLPVAATAACLTKNQLRASGTMDLSVDFAASGALAALLPSTRGSAVLRARDGYIGGAQGLSEILALNDVNQRLEDAQLKTDRSGMPFRAIEIDASLTGDRVVVDRALLKSPSIDIVVQGEVRLPDGQVALTGVALPIVNALFRQVPVLGRIVGDPIVGIPFSMGGDIGDPQVKRVRAAAVGGTLLHTLQSVVLLPVQLLGAGAGDAFGEAGAPARDRP